MTHKILIAYASNAGSTAEIASKLAEAMRPHGLDVDVRAISEIDTLSGYHGVIVGAPMILGWHRDAVRFLKLHQDYLSQIPVAYFITSLELTLTNPHDVNGVPLFLDPRHGHVPKNPAKLTRIEKRTTELSYLKPMLDGVPKVRPLSVAFFGGALDYDKLSLLPKLFVKYIIGSKPGDYRNWAAIRTWGSILCPFMQNSRDVA